MAKDYYKGVTIQYKGDSSNLSAVLAKMNAELRQSQGAARALDAALKLDPKSLDLVRDRTKVVEKQIENAKGRVEALSAALEKVKSPKFESDIADKIKAVTREMNTLRIQMAYQVDMGLDEEAKKSAEEIEKLKRKADGLREKLEGRPELIERLTQQTDVAEARLKSLNEQLVELNVKTAMGSTTLGKVATGAQELGGALQGIGESISGLGNRLTLGLTAPIAAFTVATVGAATTVDSALTDVRKTVEATEGEYQELKEAAIEYSKTNAVKADQVLQVQALGAQLGYVADELEMVGRVGTGMDIATDMGADQATTEMAQFANVTGMAHDKSENYASTIVALGNSMATTESEISGMAQSIAAVGTQVGMSEAEILGLSAALSSMGLEAQGGGSNISKIMSQIDKDVATSSKNVQTWAAVAGTSAEAFAEKWRSRPVEALQSVFAGMSSASAAGTNLSVILDALGIQSTQATDVAKRLASGHELLGKAIETANVAWRENTALAQEVANRNESLESKMQMLQNRVTAIMERIGKPVADALLGMLDAAEPLFEAIESGAKSFAEMDESEQRAIVSTAAAAAAFGPLLSVVGSLTSGVGTLLVKFGNVAEGIVTFTQYMKTGVGVTASLNAASAGLGTALSVGLVGAGIVVAVAAVAEIVAAFVKWREHADLVHDATVGLEEATHKGATAMQEYSDAVSTTAEDVKKSLDESLREVADFAEKIGDSMTDVATSAAMAESYAEQMKKLSAQSKLSADDQERLRVAVEQYNEVTGAAVEVTDAQSGALSLLPEQIDEVTAAYRRQAEQQAYTELYTEAIKLQAKNQKELDETTEELAAAQAELTRRYKAHESFVDGLTHKVIALEQKQNELSSSATALADNVVHWSDMIGSSASGFSSLEVAMTAAGITGAQYESLTEQQLTALESAFDGTLASIAALLGEYGISVKGAGDVAVSAAKDTAEKAATNVDSFATTLLDEQKSTNDESYRLQQRAWQREEQAQSKANSKAVASLREAHQEMLAELKAQHEAVYSQRSDELAREAKQQEKANEKALSELKSQQEQATKVYRAETKKRLAEMETEYKAKLKLIESEYGTESIDTQIQALRDQTKAEQSEAKKREQQDRLSELRKAVEQAKSRRKRAEAEKELSDYLADIAREQREEEREAQIEQLEQQKDLMGEEAAAKKASLKEQYDQEKEQYETERAEKLERKQTEYQEDYEAERERLATLLELQRENNSAELEGMKAQHKSIEDERSKQYSADEESLREFLDQQLQNMRDAHQDALSEMKSAGSDIVTAAADTAGEVERVVDETATETAKRVEIGAEQAKGNLLKKIQEANTLVRKPTDGVANTMLDQLNPLRNKVPKVAEDATRGLNAELEKAQPTTGSLARQLNDAAWSPLSGMPDRYKTAGSGAANALSSSLNDGRSPVESAARAVGDAQSAADKSGESGTWGLDLVTNLVNGMWNNIPLVADVSQAIGNVIDSFLHHSVPDKGPLREGGRGEAVWGADLVDNFIEGMRSREAMLADQSERLAQIVEASFMPSLSARYDASLSTAQDPQRWVGAAQRDSATVVKVEMDLSLSGLSTSNTTDIRAASEMLAEETVRKINAKLGG